MSMGDVVVVEILIPSNKMSSGPFKNRMKMYKIQV